MEAATKPDGRTVRAERTRQAVVQALLELLDGGDPRPTVEQIAARAGVSERSVFQHFPDREALFEAAARRQAERVVPTLVRIDPSLPLPERIDAFVRQRARLLETVSGVRRGAVLIEHESTTVRRWLQDTRRRTAREVERVFARELDAAPDSLTAAVVAVCAWTAWEGWRTHQGLSAARAEDAMRIALTRLLA